MDGFSSGLTPTELSSESARHYLRLSLPLDLARPTVVGLSEQRLEDLETLVITKTVAGFNRDCIEHFRQTIRDAAAGRLGRLKFLVFDFAHKGEAGPADSDQFDALVTEAANLIMQAPVILIANARGPMTGVDLEFALACSMLIGEAGVSFSFAADPVVSMGTYGFLAQKLGFVRAERLMEGGESLTAEQMQDLFLLKAVAEDGMGMEGVRNFLLPTSRRHNSCYGIYRAHRMASPAVREARRAVG